MLEIWETTDVFNGTTNVYTGHTKTRVDSLGTARGYIEQQLTLLVKSASRLGVPVSVWHSGGERPHLNATYYNSDSSVTVDYTVYDTVKGMSERLEFLFTEYEDEPFLTLVDGT